MKIVRKDAAITSAPSLSDGPGTFEAILSAPTKDRDGDTLLPDEWKTPLPDKITVDVDHEMSVKGTIGSAKPWIDDDGNLRISGTFASTPLAQEVRTLMAEGHIDRTSVAFMSTRGENAKGVTTKVRELLNAAVVAIPSNREAAILEVRGLKAGARNSAADASKVQDIHDGAVGLGADCGAKSFRKDGLAEEEAPADLADPTDSALAVDAAIDQVLAILAGLDVASLPAEIQQVVDLITAADEAADELLDALGVPDPDEDAAASGADPAPADGAPVAPAAGVRSAPVANADSDAVTVKNLEEQALQIQAAQFI